MSPRKKVVQILKPSLWYIDLMRFIDKYSNPRQSTDVLDITAIDNKDDEIDNGNGEVVIEYMDESDIENHNLSFSPPATPIFVTDNNGEDKIVAEQTLTLTAIRTAIEQRKSTPPCSNSFSNYVAYRLNSITDDDIRTAEEEITEVLFRNYKIFLNKYHNVQ
ncbi:hypothetical protein FQA39_LY17858 [Lamprigera yunnana]|nr:hypothetical protein FQA39_LY17858 [Lamprigera yunnana]